MSAPTPECGAIPPNVRGPIPCHLPPGHDGEHFSTSGCAGSEIRWSAPTPDRADNGDGLDLDAIEARAAAATAGPWRDQPMGSEGSDVIAGGDTVLTARRPARCREFVDAEFIAHAREDVPALVAEVRRLRADNYRLATLLGRRLTGAEISAALSTMIESGALEIPPDGSPVMTTAEARAALGLDGT